MYAWLQLQHSFLKWLSASSHIQTTHWTNRWRMWLNKWNTWRHACELIKHSHLLKHIHCFILTWVNHDFTDANGKSDNLSWSIVMHRFPPLVTATSFGVTSAYAAIIDLLEALLRLYKLIITECFLTWHLHSIVILTTGIIVSCELMECSCPSIYILSLPSINLDSSLPRPPSYLHWFLGGLSIVSSWLSGVGNTFSFILFSYGYVNCKQPTLLSEL